MKYAYYTSIIYLFITFEILSVAHLSIVSILLSIYGITSVTIPSYIYLMKVNDYIKRLTLVKEMLDPKKKTLYLLVDLIDHPIVIFHIVRRKTNSSQAAKHNVS